MHRELLSPLDIVVSSNDHKEGVLPVPGLSISLCTSMASIFPFSLTSLLKRNQSEEVPSIRLSDRFYSGNHLFSRGFAPNTIGPRARNGGSEGGCPEGDMLGGQFRYNALAAVTAPIPVDSIAKHGARVFAFCSAAAVLTPSAWVNKDIMDIITGSGDHSNQKNFTTDVISSSRLSVGCGFSLPVGPARLELSYALPVLKASSDSVRQFQVGLGLSII